MDPFTKPQQPAMAPSPRPAACRPPEMTPLQASTRFVDALDALDTEGRLGFLVGCTIAEHRTKGHNPRIGEAFAALGDLVRAVTRELD